MSTPKGSSPWLPWLAIAVSALLYAASFPPFRLRPLAWVALVPLFVMVRRLPTGRALGITVVWSFAMAYATGTWLPPAIATYFEQPLLVGFLFFLFVAGSMVGPYYVVFTLAYRGLARRPGPWLPLLAASAWVVAELLRGRLFTGTPVFIGNPWALLGYSQVGFDAATQAASLGGIYLVSFTIAAVNAALAELWLGRERLAAAPGRAAATLLAGAAPALLSIAWGSLELRDADADAGAGGGVRVAVVQGNLDLGSRWKPEFYGRNLDVYLQLTRASFVRSAPDLVFWPEAAMTFFVDQEPAYRRALGRVLVAGDAELVAGAPRVEGDEDDPRYYNTVYVFDPHGEIRERYDKEYLVPFAEYFPLRIDLLRRQFGRAREFGHGTPGPPLPTRAGAAGIVVCNEAMLPEVVSARVSRGAQYLVNPSNDSWLADAQYSEMQFDVVSVRAVEQRRFLVRASTSGPSAVVDPWGRVVVRSEPLTRTFLHGDVRSRDDRTLYNRAGDAFAVACAAAVLAGLAPLGRRRGPGGEAEEGPGRGSRG